MSKEICYTSSRNLAISVKIYLGEDLIRRIEIQGVKGLVSSHHGQTCLPPIKDGFIDAT